MRRGSVEDIYNNIIYPVITTVNTVTTMLQDRQDEKQDEKQLTAEDRSQPEPQLTSLDSSLGIYNTVDAVMDDVQPATSSLSEHANLALIPLVHELQATITAQLVACYRVAKLYRALNVCSVILMCTLCVAAASISYIQNLYFSVAMIAMSVLVLLLLVVYLACRLGSRGLKSLQESMNYAEHARGLRVRPGAATNVDAQLAIRIAEYGMKRAKRRSICYKILNVVVVVSICVGVGVVGAFSVVQAANSSYTVLALTAATILVMAIHSVFGLGGNGIKLAALAAELNAIRFSANPLGVHNVLATARLVDAWQIKRFALTYGPTTLNLSLGFGAGIPTSYVQHA